MTATSPETTLRETVHAIVNETPVLDIHTHLFGPRFGTLCLWGIDEMLTYHYVLAELFRVAPIPYDQFWAMSQQQQADYAWRHLFVERSPISESCRGVLTVLNALGIDVKQPNLDEARKYFASVAIDTYIDKVFTLANVKRLIMTNDPFDANERPAWESGRETDGRFQSALRIDFLFDRWDDAMRRLNEWGYAVTGDLGPADLDAVKRFLSDWVERIEPRYLAASMPATFNFPEDTVRAKLLEHCMLPVARQAGIPLGLMIGVQRQTNPELRLAGDSVGKGHAEAVVNLCRQFPDNRFLVTMLSRENQHELCVAARKFSNLLVFGCWWFLNCPSIIEEMTRERFELLGLSVVPQHSDARVLDQLIYKWAHSRRIIADVLADKYTDLVRAGWTPTEQEIRRDVADLFGNVFERFCGDA